MNEYDLLEGISTDGINANDLSGEMSEQDKHKLRIKEGEFRYLTQDYREKFELMKKLYRKMENRPKAINYVFQRMSMLLNYYNNPFNSSEFKLLETIAKIHLDNGSSTPKKKVK